MNFQTRHNDKGTITWWIAAQHNDVMDFDAELGSCRDSKQKQCDSACGDEATAEAGSGNSS